MPCPSVGRAVFSGVGDGVGPDGENAEDRGDACTWCCVEIAGSNAASGLGSAADTDEDDAEDEEDDAKEAGAGTVLTDGSCLKEKASESSLSSNACQSPALKSITVLGKDCIILPAANRNTSSATSFFAALYSHTPVAVHRDATSTVAVLVFTTKIKSLFIASGGTARSAVGFKANKCLKNKACALLVLFPKRNVLSAGCIQYALSCSGVADLYCITTNASVAMSTLRAVHYCSTCLTDVVPMNCMVLT
jgi:hypothetical protein